MRDVVGLLSHWAVGNAQGAEIVGEQSGAILLDVGDRRFVLKRKAGALDVVLEADLLTHLTAQGLPVALPLQATGGGYVVPGEDAGYCLYPYLPGQAYDCHYNQDDGVDDAVLMRASAYGSGLARLHEGLATLPDANVYPEMELPTQLCEWVRPTLEKSAPNFCDLDPIYALLGASLFDRYGELPQQAIHRDAHPGNMLILDGEVSGYIDFEIATRGPRIFDLAYCSTALLAAAEGMPARREAWPALVEALVAGYAGVQEPAEVETALLGQVQMAIQLIFAAYYASADMPAQMVANLESLQWLMVNQPSITQAIQRAF